MTEAQNARTHASDGETTPTARDSPQKESDSTPDRLEKEQPEIPSPPRHEIPAFTSLLKTKEHGWLCPQCKGVDNRGNERPSIKFDSMHSLGFVTIRAKIEFADLVYDSLYKNHHTYEHYMDLYIGLKKDFETFYKDLIKDYGDTYKEAAEGCHVAYFVNPAFSFKCLNVRCKTALRKAEDCKHENCKAFDRREVDSTHPTVADEFRPQKLDDPQYDGENAKKLELRLRRITKGLWPCPKCCISRSDLDKFKENADLNPDLMSYVHTLKEAIFGGNPCMMLESVRWHPDYEVYVWWNKWPQSHGACTNEVTESGDRCGWEWGANFMDLPAIKSGGGNGAATYWNMLISPLMGRS